MPPLSSGELLKPRSEEERQAASQIQTYRLHASSLIQSIAFHKRGFRKRPQSIAAIYQTEGQDPREVATSAYLVGDSVRSKLFVDTVLNIQGEWTPRYTHTYPKFEAFFGDERGFRPVNVHLSLYDPQALEIFRDAYETVELIAEASGVDFVKVGSTVLLTSIAPQ